MESNDMTFVLREKEMLQDRYRIDSVLNSNGMTITYLAYDTFREQKIVIKELFPNSIVERWKDDGKTVVCARMIHEKDFLTMREHMIKKAKTLISMFPLEGIANVINLFEENQTIYLVEEYAEGVSPFEFMQKIHSHEELLKDMLKLLEPIMNALDALHKKGIVHGRISPSMIRTKNKKVVLVGFGDPIEDAMLPVLEESTARVPGYAAVEQYMENATLNSSTDIYAVAAIIYEAITRTKVAPFYERVGSEGEDFVDPVVEPKKINPGIMQYQSDALMKAIDLYQFNRFTSFAEFKEALSEEEFKEERKIVMHKQPAYFAENNKYKKTVKILLIAGIIFCLIFFIPKAFRFSNSSGAKQFYLTLDSADVAHQCKMIVELSEGKRASYANDYNRMDEPGISDNTDGLTFETHYYDKITKRFVTNKNFNLDGDMLDYIRLDYRRNNTAILTFSDGKTSKQINVDLKPDMFGVYTVIETVHDGNGNVTNKKYQVEW